MGSKEKQTPKVGYFTSLVGVPYLAALPNGELGGDVVIDGTLDVLRHPKTSPSHPFHLYRQGGEGWLYVTLNNRLKTFAAT